ncbi:MAG: mismatch repair protein MutS2 [Blastocatellia bacterium]|jgi:DNA mismatch repair protein MutS2|nr:mismatch repair protein MutS2 [Blastocatellia bacterium]
MTPPKFIMNEQAFKILEFDQLRALIRRGAQTPFGRAAVDELKPLADLDLLRRGLQIVAETVAIRKRGVRWSFEELPDPADALARLQIAGVALDSLALLALARWCETAMSTRASLLAERDTAPNLFQLVANLPGELNSIAARVTNKILPSGELDDRASSELARIRHDIARLRSNITRSLESLMRQSPAAIQDELVTIRNDRFVIPVRADHRGQVGGVAHGFSSSGATVFIEPLKTIEANNELQSLREAEEREIAKILFALSEDLRGELPAIGLAVDATAQLDFVGAKASFAAKFNCVAPEIVSGATLEFIDARHPLLEENLSAAGGEVVPVAFALNDEHDSMVISGANAGGKTVVLKTAGLLSLMALSGVPVPAREMRLPFYASVLADIGDHQSIAANLSTFTSHVANIAKMIELCAPPALVLLDEVGTGTDPEEGSALGVAVVDQFRRACGANVIATTHYGGLKMYAANEAGVMNASVEFDEKTLRPTYRLLVGIAGSSSGLEIARRFGIPAEIINAAHAVVGESSRSAAEYLGRIKREAGEAEALRRALEEERAAVAEKYALLDKQAERDESERQRAFQQALQTTVSELEKRSRELIATIQDRSQRLKVERESQRRVAELKREAQRATNAGGRRETISGPSASTTGRAVKVMRDGQVVPKELALASGAGEEQQVSYVSGSPRPIVVGDKVKLRSFGSIGIVDQIKGDEIEVRVKALRFREKLENLELVEAVNPVKNDAGRFAKLRSQRAAEVSLRGDDQPARVEINVIGQTTDEAVDAVDKFLDVAFMNSQGRLRIIHGHGTGALRRAIAELLKGHPHVERFLAAPQDQGGSGATLVELKS